MGELFIEISIIIAVTCIYIGLLFDVLKWYFGLVLAVISLTIGVLMFILYDYDNPSIDEAPYVIGDYYANSYEIDNGYVILDDYWLNGKYYDKQIMIPKLFVTIKER